MDGENLFKDAINSTVNNSYVFGSIILVIMIAIYFTFSIHNLNDVTKQIDTLEKKVESGLGSTKGGGTTVNNSPPTWINGIIDNVFQQKNLQIIILGVYFILTLSFLFLYNRAKTENYGKINLFTDIKDKVKQDMGLPIANLVTKVGYIFGGLGLLVAIIVIVLWLYNSFRQLHAVLSVVLTALNLVLLLTLVYVIFKPEVDRLMNYKSNNLNFVENLFKIVGEFIFIIPCLVIVLIDVLKHEIQITAPTVWIVLIAEVIVISFYFLIPFLMTRLNTHDSRILLEGPVYLDKRRMIGTYQNVQKNDMYRKRIEDHKFSLFKTQQVDDTYDASTNTFANEASTIPFNVTVDLEVNNSKGQRFNFNYNYAVSLFLYINPQPPNTSQAYVVDTPVFDYAGKPKIVYNGLEQQLKFVCTDVNNLEKTVYQTNDIKFQRWMHIVVNYRSGVVDVFIDGSLRATESNVQPFMEYSKIYVGSNEGIAGGIKNVMYFHEPLSIDKIKYMNNFR